MTRRTGVAARQATPATAPLAARIACAAVAILLLTAAPASNLAWSVDGLRTLAPATAMLVAVAALTFAWLALRPGVVGWLAVIALVPLVAFGAVERIHLLGDTWVRTRFLAVQVMGEGALPGMLDLASQLHAQPLDLLFNVMGPLALVRLGMTMPTAFSLVSAFLFALYLAGVVRLARPLPAARRPVFVAVLVLAGTLEAFAGYTESAGVALAAGVWWWALLQEPLRDRRAAFAAAAGWLVLFLAHRVALVMLVPQLVRALGPVLPGDTAPARRRLLLLTAFAVLLACVWTLAVGGGGALGRDVSEFTRSLRDPHAWVPPLDVLALVVLVAPLALLAPAFALPGEHGAWWRSPQAALAAAALLPALPLLLLFPSAAHGLGAHRDGERAAVPGLIAQAVAAAWLAGLAAARWRGAQRLLVPLLALLAAQWLAVNADEGAAQRRAVALAHGPHGLRGEQLGHVEVFLGYRADNLERPAEAARWFDESFEALRNPRNALLATESWLRAGDPAAARRSLARARAGGRLPPDLERGAGVLESYLPRDSAGTRQRAGSSRDSAGTQERAGSSRDTLAER